MICAFVPFYPIVCDIFILGFESKLCYDIGGYGIQGCRHDLLTKSPGGGVCSLFSLCIPLGHFITLKVKCLLGFGTIFKTRSVFRFWTQDLV